MVAYSRLWFHEGKALAGTSLNHECEVPSLNPQDSCEKPRVVAVIAAMLRWEAEAKGTLEAPSPGNPCYMVKFGANKRPCLK